MQFIVDFKNTTTQQDIDAYLATNGLTVVKEFNHFEKVFVVTGNAMPAFTEIIEHLVNDDEHPISLLNTTIISDQSYGKKTLSGEVITVENTQNNWWKSYTIKNADLDAANYSIDRRGQNSTVYVLDSGIEINHTEFANRKVSNLWSFNNDFTDKKGHGTAIASVIVGNTTGVTDANVKSVKIFDPDIPTKQSDMLNALDIVFKDVIDNQIDFAVVNCSWTISKNNLIENKMRAMIDSGIFIVAAAGNSGHSIDDVTPASMPEALTIGAYNSSLLPCDFSNYTGSIISNTQNTTNHGELDGWAPGQDIYVAGLNQTYGLVSGTSIAAGILSAALAYNLSFCTPSFRGNTSYKDFYSTWSLGRKDLLNLSDPKYSNSKNLTVTVVDELSLPDGARYNWNIKGRSGQHLYVNLFNPQITEKLEIFGTLPAGYTITNTGKFYGFNPDIIENYNVFSVPIKITYTNGTSYDADLEIINIRSDYDVSQSTGDPILDIKLQFTTYNCDYFVITCYQPAANESCVDVCAGIYFCDYFGAYKPCGGLEFDACVCAT